MKRVMVVLALLAAGACSCELTAYKNNEQTGCECPKPTPAAVPEGGQP